MRRLLAPVVLLAVGAAALWTPTALRSQDAQKDKEARAADEKALLEAIYDYKEAFNKGDADAVARHFTENAELIDDSGEPLQGRDAIARGFATAFKANSGAKLDLRIDWFRWLSADVIVEHGSATITSKDGTVTPSKYTAVHVKKEGKWLIASVREIPAVVPGDGSAQTANLHGLDWLVGEWVDADDSGKIEMRCSWNPTKTFLKRTFRVLDKQGQVQLEGTEVIGWDQSRGILRSWTFDSSGTFAESIWLPRSDKWYVKVAAVRPDGAKASALHIYTMAGPDRYVWRSIHRQLAGEVQPDLPEVTVKRIDPQGDK